MIESQGRTPQGGMWRRTHVNTGTHIFAPKPFGLCSKQYVNGAAMLVVRVVVGRIPTVCIDSSTLHYDEYRGV